VPDAAINCETTQTANEADQITLPCRADTRASAPRGLRRL